MGSSYCCISQLNMVLQGRTPGVVVVELRPFVALLQDKSGVVSDIGRKSTGREHDRTEGRGKRMVVVFYCR